MATAKFDLTLTLAATAEGAARRRSSTARDLFDAATIERHAGPPASGCWRQVAADAGRAALARCRCSAGGARTGSLVEWNDTARRIPRSVVRPRAVRGAGGADARTRWRVVCEERVADLRASWTRGPTGWRTTCARWAWGRRRAWACCVERGAGAGGRRCWPSSRPAAPTCRSTRPIRAERLRLHARPTAAPAVLLTAGDAASPARRPRPTCTVVLRWTSWRDALAPEPAEAPRGGRDAGEPGLRHLHLGIDRAAQGRDGDAPAHVVHAACVRGRLRALRPGTACAAGVARVAFDALTFESCAAPLLDGAHAAS